MSDTTDYLSLPAWRRRPVVNAPHAPVRPEWLEATPETPLDPDLPIIDSHHHLWDRHGDRYLLEEFVEDIGRSGHNVVASVFVQCRTMLRAAGPAPLRPVGEVEFIRGVAAQSRSGHYGSTRVAAAIIGGPDLMLGDGVSAVLDAMTEAGGGLFRGVRTPVAAHPDATVRSNPVPAPEGLMLTDAFNAGARAVMTRGLTLDLWVYQNQLHEVAVLADRNPDLTIVLDHAGGPIGVGPYTQDRTRHFADWRAGLARVAERPNVMVKLGGFGMPIMGFGFAAAPVAPSSKTIAQAIGPHVQACVELFGARRCMFESNVPVDKGSFAYAANWNAYQRLTEGWSAEDIQAIFSGTAARVYRLREP